MNRTKRFLLHCFLISLMISSSCLGACVKMKEKHEIKTNFEVRVQDPYIRRLTEVTSNVEVVASGKFAPGTFLLRKAIVAVPPDTDFHISLSLPIKNPAVLSTAHASGELSTSNQLSFNGIPVPKTVELKEGTVSGQVDLARSVAAFFLNLVQVDSVSGDMKDMLRSMKIEELVLDLREGSTLKLGQKTIKVGPDSQVRLTGAQIDKYLNYIGECHLDINFASNSKWIGEKVDCEFDGGKIDCIFEARKSNDKLTLNLPENKESMKPVLLKNCTVRFGKDKRCSTVSDTISAIVKTFEWQEIKGEDHPTLHLVSALDFAGTDLRLKTDVHQTIGRFPEKVPGVLEVVIKKDARSTSFKTTSSARAQTGQIIIANKKTRLTLTLANAVIGPVVFSKEGALQFVLEGGVANLKQLDWRAGESQFTLDCGANSIMTVPKEMLLAKYNDQGPTRVNLPVKLNLGSASLRTRSGKIDLANLNGTIVVDVGRQTKLRSDMTFTLKDLKILSGYAATINARGIELEMADGHSKLSLNRCRITVPDNPLKKAIRSRVPKEFSFKLDKTVKEDKTWRYRNAIAKDVKVTNLKLEDMKAKGPNLLGITASGDALVNGTVEKTGIIFKKAGWETCPWKISGHIKGEGTVKYVLNKNGGSGGDKVKYELSMQLPIPEDIELDWSKVAGGLVKIAEKKVIISRLKQITVPISYKGEIDIMEQESPALRRFKVSNVSITDAPNGGPLIEFVAKARGEKE